MHFIFNTKLKPEISPFARKFSYLQRNGPEALTNFEENEKEAFEGYIEKKASGDLDPEEDKMPVVYGDMPEDVFNVDIASSMSKLVFATADDPFYKLSTARYYPEALVFNKSGALLHKVGPGKQSDGPLSYQDDIRDPKLKINDDKKILISLR